MAHPPKIAYVAFYPNEVLAGWKERISGQAKAAAALGLPVDFLVLNDDREERDGLVHYVRLPYASRWATLRKGERGFAKYRLIRKAIDLRPYDAVVLRYPPGGDLTFSAAFGDISRRSITEHHTNEMRELRLACREDRSLLPALALEALTGGPILARVAGIIGVTDELRRLELARSGPKPSAVIANGIDTEAVVHTGFTPFDGRQMTLVSIASLSAPWHGLDRLLRGLRDYRGEVAVHLTLIGILSHEVIEAVRALGRPTVSVHMTGALPAPRCAEFFARATLAVSTLALHRNGMAEACPLKSREYVARGVPLVCAYDDPDIPASCRFVLQVEKDDSPVSIDRLLAFAHEVSRPRDLAAEMREFARRRLDWRVKMQQMQELAEQVLSRR